jgi:uncharacterized protein (DUF3084 family)
VRIRWAARNRELKCSVAGPNFPQRRLEWSCTRHTCTKNGAIITAVDSGRTYVEEIGRKGKCRRPVMTVTMAQNQMC